ncbi:MAG: class I SAM-dependent methyltransferase [Planctomycetota bacterium]
MKMKPNTQVQHNKRAHDSVASSYERIHTEIYNPTEQARIARVLEDAISHITTLAEFLMVLDFGAGTGNLTRHLLNLGTKVVAADVSLKGLISVKETFSKTGRLEIAELNGVDLSNFEDSSFDMVATYSVLHHVLDYLGIVKEFVRVVKPGGVIYIDHESAPCFWLESSDDFKVYRKELQNVYGMPFVGRLARKLKNLFSYHAWRRLVNSKLLGLCAEGDIHVFKDDHIEWNRVEELLLKQCVVLKSEDYLVCREVNRTPPLHEKHRAKCVDMHFVICRKN